MAGTGVVVSAVSSGIALAIDAVTFIVSAVSLAAMRSKKVAIMFPISAAFLTAGALFGLSRHEIRKL